MRHHRVVDDAVHPVFALGSGTVGRRPPAPARCSAGCRRRGGRVDQAHAGVRWRAPASRRWRARRPGCATRHRDVVLDVEPFLRLCASGIDSRRCHIAFACAGRWPGHGGVGDQPRSSAAASRASKRCARVGAVAGRLLEQHRPGRARQRLRQCGKWRRTSRARNGSSPRSRSARAEPRLAPAEQAHRIVEPLAGASAVVARPGGGYSFSVAAVMTPSVPSLPMKRSRRS